MTQIGMGSELTPDDVERISRYFPTCRQCGARAKYIVAYFEERRELNYEVDGSRNIPDERDRVLISVSTEAETRERTQPNRGDYARLECGDCLHQWIDGTIRVTTSFVNDLGYLHVRKNVKLD